LPEQHSAAALQGAVAAPQPASAPPSDGGWHVVPLHESPVQQLAGPPQAPPWPMQPPESAQQLGSFCPQLSRQLPPQVPLGVQHDPPLQTWPELHPHDTLWPQVAIV
jgi:hypothetical protein